MDLEIGSAALIAPAGTSETDSGLQLQKTLGGIGL